MPQYTLREVDPHIWSLFTERAGREGWPTKALLVKLMDAYGHGHISISAPPPKQLPQWAWLRAHYREVARNESFRDLDVSAQWEALVEHVLSSPGGLSSRDLDGVSPTHQAEILRWLRETCNVSQRQVLTLRAIAHFGEGPDLQTNRRAFHYEVLGLPARQQAWIADFGGGWRVLRALDGKSDNWTEERFLTKEDALDTLARTLDGD